MTHTLFVTCTRSLSNLVPPFRRCLQWSGGFNHSISIRAASRWSQEEDDAVIRARRNGLRNSKIATILLPHRTPSAVLSRMRTLFRKEAGTFQRRNLPRQALTKGQFDEIVRAKDIDKLSWRAIRDTMFPAVTIATIMNMNRFSLHRRGVLKPASHARYSAEEDAQILESREVHKLPWVAISEHLPGRSPDSVASRYSKLRPNCDCWPRVLPKGIWTEAQAEELMRLTNLGMKDAMIATALGKSRNAISVHRHVLRKRGAHDPLKARYDRQRWTEEETKRALDLQAQGYDRDHIAQQLGKTPVAIQSKLWSMPESAKASAVDSAAKVKIEKDGNDVKTDLDGWQ